MTKKKFYNLQLQEHASLSPPSRKPGVCAHILFLKLSAQILIHFFLQNSVKNVFKNVSPFVTGLFLFHKKLQKSLKILLSHLIPYHSKLECLSLIVIPTQI